MNNNENGNSENAKNINTNKNIDTDKNINTDNSNKANNDNNKSFRSEEPPPDEEDFHIAEEERKQKEMYEHLKEQERKHREMMKRNELSKIMKEEYEAELRLRELVANRPYIERRNQTALQRAKDNNLRIRKMLEKVDAYMNKIHKLDTIDQIKKEAQQQYEEEINRKKRDKGKITKESINRLAKLNNKNSELREENKRKIKERDEEDKLKKEKIKKSNLLNEKVQNILKNGFVNNNKKENEENNNNNNNNNKLGNGLFEEEEDNVMQGTNLCPDMIYNNNNTNNNINNNNTKEKELKTHYLPAINENANITAENELRKILKNDRYNMKKLLDFKKRHKNFDISSYLHTAKMNQILTKGTRLINSDNHNENKFHDNKDVKYKSYLESCKNNSSEYIQSHLLSCKSEEELFEILNEKDEYNRNGLMYLLIHNNINMIKLTLMSGVILSDCRDIYDRNLIHYCCSNENISSNLFDIICHCIVFENKEDFNGMLKYVDKCLGLINEDEIDSEYNSEENCKQRIEAFDNKIENKDKALKPYEIAKKKNEEDMKKETRRLNINGNSNNNNIDFKKHQDKSTIIHNQNNFIESVKTRKIPMKKLINHPDIDMNYPIHICATLNDLDKIKVLIFYNVRLDVVDQQGKKPIDLTSNNLIQQYLLKNEKNFESKFGKKTNNPNDNLFNSNAGNNTYMSNHSINSLLDKNKLEYYSSEDINKFTTGYENNNYLILSVINKNFDIFRFLLVDKNCKVDFRNSNGLTVLHIILLNKLYHFFAFLFGLSESCNSSQDLLKEFEKKVFTKQDIFKDNGSLTYTGEALKIVDYETNKNINLLTISIDTLKSLDLFKCLLILYDNQIEFFNDESSPLEIVLNRQYDKNHQTLLIKCVQNKTMDILQYLIYKVHKKKCNLDLYKGDIKNMNMLHYAIINKDKKFIQFLIKYDADKNELRQAKDSKGKIPSDYDNSKNYVTEMNTIWDAAKNNDIDLLDKLINSDLYKYYNVNDQLTISKNTALHIAAYNLCDKACLFLVKNNIDINIKNKKGQTALDYLLYDPTKPKSFINKFKKIINKEITEFVDLNKSFTNKNNNNSMVSNSNNSTNKKVIKNKRLIEIIGIIKAEFEKRKLDIKKVFSKLDKNKNGVLEGNEFELLFTVLDIPGLSGNDILLLNSYLDENKNGLIEYEEFIKLVE